MSLKHTPLYEQHVKAKGQIVDFAGFELPIQYVGITEEHEAVRNNVGLFDVSHMGEVEVKGKDALKFVQNLVANNVRKLVDNQVLYTVMCYENGTVVDDLLVYRFEEDYFYLVINAANVDKDFEWMKGQSEGFDISLENISDNVAQLALQGPNAQDILQGLVDVDLKSIEFFHCNRQVMIGDVKALVSRTGYTGEDGFEIYVSNNDAVKVWELLIDKDVMPIGLGARDTLRFEACLPLYGHEISDEINPLEAGLSMFVKLDNDDFIGKDALVEIKETGIKRKLVGLEIAKGIAREGYEVLCDDQVIGHITTGYKSPTVGKSVALALVDRSYGEMGKQLMVQVRKKQVPATIISKRFYKKNYKK
ncbi:glycine cleavage system aminomethyltransferase GcvT [Acidaminobacter sp. JC074]|uniref:glycine cleavage system aminomethyltransferase GcvT n=1 Tax=Acidaminobacter sp. JC074 TaxID=2530199 RepID=UPI001F0F2E19|nr:glycine cleavage system aminomethyltransferase GcvT [Acidaminobacter sp. JC074]MCH4888861.1 glycine cleavage system aminomethyltransferase GcvT [Acidaminobacter sp. JC074]